MKTLEKYSATRLIPWLNNAKALVITRARQVSKTTLLKKMLLANDQVLWLNTDKNTMCEKLVMQNEQSVKNITGNYQTFVIDEIQRVTKASLLLKLQIDNFNDVNITAACFSSIDIAENIFELLTKWHLLFNLCPFPITKLYAGNLPFDFSNEKINAFELNWQIPKEPYFNNAFLNSYALAETAIIARENFTNLCYIN